MDDQNIYIAGIGLLTGLGATAEAVARAVNADISCYANSGYVDQSHSPVRMALVPQDALPPLNDDIPFCGTYSRWDKHLLQLAHGAITTAVEGISFEQPVPVVLACSEHYPQWPHVPPKSFIPFLSQQCDIEFCPDQSRILHVGRAGFIDAIDIAQRLLFETENETVLVGGIDSYQRPNLIHGLLEEGRVSGPGVMDGFTPGEGSGFLLLTKNKDQALVSQELRLCLGGAGSGHEAGHMYSDDAYRGDGLAQAVKGALASFEGPQISHVFSSMNGENFWAKELGVALARSSKSFGSVQPQIEHPADCYGDLGAATGAALAGVSAQNLLEQPNAGAHLVCCSSDHAYRSAIVVYTENVTDSQEAQL